MYSSAGWTEEIIPSFKTVELLIGTGIRDSLWVKLNCWNDRIKKEGFELVGKVIERAYKYNIPTPIELFKLFQETFSKVTLPLGKWG